MQALLLKIFYNRPDRRRGVYYEVQKGHILSVKFGIMVPTETNVPLDCFLTTICFRKLQATRLRTCNYRYDIKWGESDRISTLRLFCINNNVVMHRGALWERDGLTFG